MCVIMPGSQDWRGSLTASERYDNIQKMSVSRRSPRKATAFVTDLLLTSQAILSNQRVAVAKTAFTLENEAYSSSSSRASA